MPKRNNPLTETKIIGTCSECHGPVMGINGVKTCQRCGAVEKKDYGPIVPMEPTRPRMPRPRDDDPLPPWPRRPWKDRERWVEPYVCRKPIEAWMTIV